MRWQFLLYTLLTHFILFFTEFLSINVSDECTKKLRAASEGGGAV